MSFLDSAIFPLEAGRLRASSGWNTTIVRTGGGSEQRNGNYTDALRRYDAALGIKTLANYQTLEKFLNAVRGRLHGFRFLDRSNYLVSTAEAFGTGTGAQTAFQLTKNDGNASNAYNREIYKPITGTIAIFDNAVLKTETTHYTINYNTGVVTFLVAPVAAHVLTWTGEFHVPVRFDVDELPDMELFEFYANGVGMAQASVPMCEIRDIA
jgi:uncharacterized protein (TIGR02217 family)